MFEAALPYDERSPANAVYPVSDTLVTGTLKRSPADFQVHEVLPFAPDGDGTHLMLLLRREGMNTEFLARRIAQLCGVAIREIGWAGLKDRHADVTQWFSVNLKNRADPDLSELDSLGVTRLKQVRHGRKLKRGALSGNRFHLTLRHLAGSFDLLEERLAALPSHGVPNFFGPQRFGRDSGNLRKAQAMLIDGRRVRDRHLRGLYLSSARSALFNSLLAARVAAGSWNRILTGDVVQLDGRGSVFVATAQEGDLEQRALRQEIHPCGPLWGRSGMRPKNEAEVVESTALEPFAEWMSGLEKAGAERSNRALRLRVRDFEWKVDTAARTADVQFALDSGGYATTVVATLGTFATPGQPQRKHAMESVDQEDSEAPIGGELT